MSDTMKTATRTSPQGLKDKVTEASNEVRQKAGDAFEASANAARDAVGDIAGAAKNVASHAADRLGDQVSAQQTAGADYIGRFAGNVRGAARAFEQDAPFAARGINMAANYVDDAAEKIRTGTFSDLVDGATSFARRQPAAFLGLTVLAGFALVRFLKASSNETQSDTMSDPRMSNQRMPNHRMPNSRTSADY